MILSAPPATWEPQTIQQRSSSVYQPRFKRSSRVVENATSANGVNRPGPREFDYKAQKVQTEVISTKDAVAPRVLLRSAPAALVFSLRG